MKYIPQQQQGEIPPAALAQHPPILALSTTTSVPPSTSTLAKATPEMLTNTAPPALDGQNLANGYGVLGTSKLGDGVHGESAGDAMSAVAGIHSGNGKGIYGRSKGDAGYFDGNVVVNGDIVVSGDVRLNGQDCAEAFECAKDEILEPGTVVIACDDGLIRACSQRHDKRVVGIVAGAGPYKPGLILTGPPSENCKAPIALIGRVLCKVEATRVPVEVGDLLTTSTIKGMATRASDGEQTFGTVIGKALASLRSGEGMIPVLVGLR